jgi:hypothetical protein
MELIAASTKSYLPTEDPPNVKIKSIDFSMALSILLRIFAISSAVMPILKDNPPNSSTNPEII